jgi:hypothetical protein
MKMHNKVTYAIMGLTAGAALLFTAGCSKPEQPAGDTSNTQTPTAEAAKPAMTTAPATAPAVEPAPAAAAASPLAPAAAGDAQKAADVATDQMGAAVAPTTSQTQALIDKAKGLVTDQKYKDALTVVQQLASVKLTPDQRAMVDGLKAQIQTALAKDTTSDAASALGNALGGKK